MSTCTFFGHRDCPTSIKPKLYETLIDLIENKDVNNFYIGNNGNFDNIVYNLLCELKKRYTYINYNVVLAYLPNNKSDNFENTIYPERIETIPKRFAIDYRNRFMLNKADFVITYVTHSWGGASKFVDLAVKKQKQVIYL